ncbi:MAG: hypothetical protein KKA44_01825, partial [Alphaproteobacteria bacterium]|nr:hypothetical protein [Alphaproteobacteria bacterium]MBU1823703.1 hypothetical protein [Alphaproteobacteria bacterium]
MPEVEEKHVERSGCVIRDRRSCRNNLGKAFWMMREDGDLRSIAAIAPPCAAGMGRWQREALTEGL